MHIMIRNHPFTSKVHCACMSWSYCQQMKIVHHQATLSISPLYDREKLSKSKY